MEETFCKGCTRGQEGVLVDGVCHSVSPELRAESYGIIRAIDNLSAEYPARNVYGYDTV